MPLEFLLFRILRDDHGGRVVGGGGILREVGGKRRRRCCRLGRVAGERKGTDDERDKMYRDAIACPLSAKPTGRDTTRRGKTRQINLLLTKVEGGF